MDRHAGRAPWLVGMVVAAFLVAAAGQVAATPPGPVAIEPVAPNGNPFDQQFGVKPDVSRGFWELRESRTNVGPVAEVPAEWGAMEILGERVEPGEKRELVFFTSESFQALSVKSPVIVLRGTAAGPTLCITAGIHGDELNGVEIVRRVLDRTSTTALRGTIVGVPIVNMLGFERSSRYLPDRRDLNRYFPGHPEGSSASRIADAFFQAIIRRCDALVDLHTGSFHRANIAQVRGDLLNDRVLGLAKAFGAEVIVHNAGKVGTLRRAATEAGIPAIVYEAGEPMRFQEVEIQAGARGIRNILVHFGLVNGKSGGVDGQSVFYESHWIRVNHGGILVSDIRLGDWVKEEEVLARITDPMGRGRAQVISPFRGRVIGISLAPVVIPGVAVYHVGLERPQGKGEVEVEDEVPPEYSELEEERPE
jgi:hypothetical protein